MAGHRAAERLALALAHEHALDARITFVEEGHTYYLDGVALPRSVTGVIDGVASDHFDPDAIIAKMKAGRNWPNPAYSDPGGIPWTDDRIRAAWAANGAAAAELGTDLHSKIELFMNGLPVEYDEAGTNRQEFQYFLRWWEEASKTHEAYRTEWVIFDADAAVAGSVDFVMRNKTTGKFSIVDWKRCKTKEAGFQKSFGRRFLPPLAHMDEHKSNKWCVQVNVYREMLEKNYGVEVDTMCMVVFHTENDGAEVHTFPRLDVRALLVPLAK
jgi:hypothetical protein